MTDDKRLNRVASVIGLATVAAAVALSLPRPTEPDLRVWPDVTPSAAEGYRPVGPGSYTSIPILTDSNRKPAIPTASKGYRPVAPGAYTSVPETD